MGQRGRPKGPARASRTGPPDGRVPRRGLHRASGRPPTPSHGVAARSAPTASVRHLWQPLLNPPPPPRTALEEKGPQRRPQKRLDRRLEEVVKAVRGGYCRLQIPLKPALGIRQTVAGHRLGALEDGPSSGWCTVCDLLTGCSVGPSSSGGTGGALPRDPSREHGREVSAPPPRPRPMLPIMLPPPPPSSAPSDPPSSPLPPPQVHPGHWLAQASSVQAAQCRSSVQRPVARPECVGGPVQSGLGGGCTGPPLTTRRPPGGGGAQVPTPTTNGSGT